MKEHIIKKQLGGLPLLYSIVERMGLLNILNKHLPKHGNNKVPYVQSILLLVLNLTLGKEPLYKLENWVNQIDLNCIDLSDLDLESFNDDRFGRTLDKVYELDRASVATDLILNISKMFGLKHDQVHNDSTSVKAYGKIPGKTKSGVEFKRGHSKDHRPDLKQLVFSLTISNDGAVPIHYKTYPGNKTDDTTHIETWNKLVEIFNKPDFLYVADSKLCTDKQLHHIESNGGRALSILPETWKETRLFKEAIRKEGKMKREIWRRKKPKGINKLEYFHVYEGDYYTAVRGYRIHWIHSSEKRINDEQLRDLRLNKVEEFLVLLNSKLNKRKFKEEEYIKSAVDKIISKNKVKNLININIGKVKQLSKKQIGMGRPTKDTKYEIIEDHIYTLSWGQNKQAIKAEARTDGIFPLLSTDIDMTSEEALKAYKYQPRLEKRFSQFKSIHNAAPIFFKNIQRVEANMFLFFIALIIQSLLERKVRKKMLQNKINSIDIYPEERESKSPTTNSIMNLFDKNYRYELIDENKRVLKHFHDELSEVQMQVLKLLEISESTYWGE